MKKLTLGVLAIAGALAGCMSDGMEGTNDNYGQYDYNRPDPSYGGYDAARYYRDDPRYHERTLTSDDRLYRGNDGRYYCRRSDGTTGLIVGAIAGGVLGDIIAPGGSKTLGTVIGAGSGALVGHAIDANDARCR